MSRDNPPRLDIVDRHGHAITGSSRAIANLAGRPLQPNRGTSLNLDWVEGVRINTSAVERRAATLVTRRTVKKRLAGCVAPSRHLLHGSHDAQR